MGESKKIKSSEITDEQTYLNRRNFIRGGLLAGTTIATGLGYRYLNPPPPKDVNTASIENIVKQTDEVLPDEPTSLQDIANYNNYYEFSTTKTAVASKAEKFVTEPWTVSVDGFSE